MKRFHTIVFLLILCVFARGQQPMVWLSLDSLMKKGYYKNLGITNDIVRIGILTSNQKKTGQDVLLKLNNPHINKLYLINQKGDTLVNTGDHKPFGTRPVYHWDFVLPIHIHIESADTLQLIMDKRGEGLQFFLEALPEKLFYKRQMLDVLIYTFSFATSIIFAIFFLFISFLRTKLRYAILALFILATLCWILNMNGILFQLFWPDNLYLHHVARTFYSSFSIGSFVFYFLYFYWNDIPRYVRRVYFGFCGFLLFRFLFVILVPALMENHAVKSILLTTGTTIIIISLVLIILHLITFFKKKEFIIHNIAFSLYLFFVFNEGMKLIGVDLSPIPKWDMYTTILFHLIIISLFSLASFIDYRKQKKQKLNADILSLRLRNQQVSNMIVDAQEYERNAISKNIHDQVGGLMAVFKIRLETLKMKMKEHILRDELDDLIDVIDRCNSELYSIVDDLSGPEFDKLDLSEMIANRLEILQKISSINFHYTPNRLDIIGKNSLIIYRIICELISNAMKHANCSTIFITITSNEKELKIDFVDNGIGISAISNGLHRGIENIKSRVSFMNGIIHLDSKPGNTYYKIIIPMN